MSDTNSLQPEPNPYSAPETSAEAHLEWTREPVIESLSQTRPWVLLFSILGFIGAATIVCVAFFQAVLSLGQRAPREAGEAFGGAMITALLGLLYYFPALYLLRFARRIRDLTHTRRLADLEAALSAQKSFWRFCGIVVALLLALYAVILLGALGLGLLAAVQN